MQEKYPYATRQVKIVMVILHLYGARSIFLLFSYDQDTECE